MDSAYQQALARRRAAETPARRQARHALITATICACVDDSGMYPTQRALQQHPDGRRVLSQVARYEGTAWWAQHLGLRARRHTRHRPRGSGDAGLEAALRAFVQDRQAFPSAAAFAQAGMDSLYTYASRQPGGIPAVRRRLGFATPAGQQMTDGELEAVLAGLIAEHGGWPPALTSSLHNRLRRRGGVAHWRARMGC